VLSVVVPTYNRASVLARCLDALRDQVAEPNEIVVVDDGSTDETQAVLHDRSGWVRVVAQENGGRAAAKNAGVEAATGTVVLFIDDDIIATPGLVARHIQFHLDHPAETDALLGRVTWSPEVEVTRHMHWLEHGGPLFAYDSIDDPAHVGWRLFYTCNVSLKRAFFEPFDVALPIFEDSEMAYRLTKRGLTLRYDASALGHHLREETPERTERRMREVGEAAALLHAKWPELREDPPALSAAGQAKARAAMVASALGVHRWDDQLDSWRAARAYRAGYLAAATSSSAPSASR
jgi:glycosyltransferase involved in cell wall biosynthesis